MIMRMQLDIAVQFCFVLAVGSVISLWFLLDNGWWLLLPLALLTLAWLSYRAAVAVARVYGSMMDTVVDLYRFDLLEALHLPLPATRKEEQEVNTELCDVIDGRDPKFQAATPFQHPTSLQKGEISVSVATPLPDRISVRPENQDDHGDSGKAWGGEH